MEFEDYASAIRAIGREINPTTLDATRALLTPLVSGTPAADVRVQRDVAYGAHERQRCDIFTPASGDEPQRPLLIFVHGGGFVAGDKCVPGTPFYDNIGTWAVHNGCNAVNLTYRLAPEHQWPSGIDDLHAALTLVRERGATLGIDGGRVFLMGQSAGAAHAASYVAHAERYAPDPHGLSGLILLSGVYDYSQQSGPLERAYLGDDTRLYAARSSLAGLVDCDIPLLVTLAENDPPDFERQGLALLTALQQKHGQLPRTAYLTGQNHLSVALYLGLPGDLLAPQLLSFIATHSGA